MKTLNGISMMALLVAVACNVPLMHNARAAGEVAAPPISVSAGTGSTHPTMHTAAAAAKVQHSAVQAAHPTAHTAGVSAHTSGAGANYKALTGAPHAYTYTPPLSAGRHQPSGPLKLKMPEGPKYRQDEGFRQRYEAMMNGQGPSEEEASETQSPGPNGFRGPYIGHGGAAGTAGSWSAGNPAENDNIAGLSGGSYNQ